MKPQRIQLSRKKGWKKPENTVVVSRPSKWGNHWKVGEVPRLPGCLADMFIVSTAEEAVENFAAYLDAHPLVVADAKRELRGKNLGCWCKLGTACHADVLLRIANE